MGAARDILEKRRGLEYELAALRRQINWGGGRAGTSSTYPKIEKVPGKNEYIFAPRGTNNPEGAALQHAGWYEDMLNRRVEENQSLIRTAEYVIDLADDSIDRGILRDYYCSAMRDAQIAEAMHFERSTVSYRRHQALAEVDSKFGP